MTKLLLPFLVLLAMPLLAEITKEGAEQINALAQTHAGSPAMLKGTEGISTKASFKPPVEIIIVAKTDSTDLRMGYAADQVIFNWRNMITQLRVDGGPANGKHKSGAGSIPTNKYVTIKWVVTPKKQTISVDDQLRFEHEGDYSGINNPISISSNQSKVTVKSIKVKPLPPDTQ